MAFDECEGSLRDTKIKLLTCRGQSTCSQCCLPRRSVQSMHTFQREKKKMIPLCYCKMKGNISFINLLFLLRSSSNFLSPPTYSFSTHEATFHHFIMSHSGEGQQPISSQYGASVADLLLTLYSLIHSTCGSLSHL